MDPAVREQWLTLIILIGIVLEVILIDICLAKTYGVNATFSRVLSLLFDKYPISLPVVVFAVGVLIGHVLLPAHIRH